MRQDPPAAVAPVIPARAPGGVSADQTVTAGYGHRTALEVSV